jgi:hypothetical protein
VRREKVAKRRLDIVVYNLNKGQGLGLEREGEKVNR